METEPKHVVPSGMDTIICVAIITAGLVAFLCSGHAGVILVLAIFICIWLLCDLMKIYQYYRLGKDPEVVISSGQMPMRPKLPVQWFALSLIAQSAGLLCQLICGWTVLSGCCLLFFYGCELVCHLFYYSSTVVENSTTTLPTLSMGALVIWFVLSGSGTSYGYMDLGRWGGLFWVCASGVVGMVFGKFFLDFLKVQPLGESRPLTAQASQKAAAAGAASESSAKPAASV